MKICFVCNEYPPASHGGIGTFVRTLGTFLARQSHEVSVVGFGENGSGHACWTDKCVKVFSIRVPARWLSASTGSRYTGIISAGLKRIVLSRAVSRLCKDRRIDVVESYDWSGPLWHHPPVPLLVRLHGANTALCSYQRYRPSRELRHFERRNLAMADRLVAVSEHIGSLTVQSLGLANKRYRVIYNGVDTELFRPSGMPRDADEVLYVGAVSRRKGLEELFRAIPFVVSQRPRTRFRIVGAISKTERGDGLDDYLLAQLPTGCRSSVQFLGRIVHEALPQLYNRASVCVFPSLAEAFGLTCVEAMACGCPAVMTNQASGPEIVQQGVSGFLADPRDPQRLSACLLKILDNPELQQGMAKAARDRVEARFSLGSLADATVEEYANLVSSPAHNE